MSNFKEDDRVMTILGEMGTVQEANGDVAYVLMDTQAHASQPKPIPTSELTYVSTLSRAVPLEVLDKPVQERG